MNVGTTHPKMNTWISPTIQNRLKGISKKLKTVGKNILTIGGEEWRIGLKNLSLETEL